MNLACFIGEEGTDLTDGPSFRKIVVAFELFV